MAQTYEINLVNLIQKFNCDGKCRTYLEALRWPDGVECPRCQCQTVSRIEDRDQFDCNACRYQFSVTSGTIMHDTKLPLWKWFLAVYLMVESKKGISANQLKRTLDVSYRTAWYLCHRIRKALETPEGFLRGVIEVDETFIGGYKKGTRGDRSNKTMVIGAKSRETGEIRVKADTVQGTSPSTAKVGKFLRANIANDSVVYTDENPAYKALLQGGVHEAVNHSKDEWVKGDVHTNGIEGAWGLFKRSVVGSYHQLSCKHLNAYLDEFEFRFNNRDNAYIFRDAMVCILNSQNIEYAELTA